MVDRSIKAIELHNITKRLALLEEGSRAGRNETETNNSASADAVDKERSLSEAALGKIWTVLLAYYLGGLTSDGDESDPLDPEAKALRYECCDDFFDAVVTFVKHGDRIIPPNNEAYRRLFAKRGLDFETTPRKDLFEALVTMVDQLPDQWLTWLRSNLRQWAPHAKIAVGSNLPRRLSGDNAFPFAFAGEPMRHKSSTRKR